MTTGTLRSKTALAIIGSLFLGSSNKMATIPVSGSQAPGGCAFFVWSTIHGRWNGGWIQSDFVREGVDGSNRTNHD